MYRRETCALLLCLLGHVAQQGAAIVPESCEGLDNIAAHSTLDCYRNDTCLSLDCNATGTFSGIGAIVNLLPCNNPPAIELIFKTPLGQNAGIIFSNSVPRKTVDTSLTANTVFRTIVTWISTRTATITAAVISTEQLGDISSTVVSPTNVTLPPCSVTPSPTPSPSPPPPASNPSPTCAALQKLAIDATQNEGLNCITGSDADCDTLQCVAMLNGLPVNTDVEVLPCNNPPGISLVVKFNGNILVDQIITKSQKIDLFGDVVAVNVTLNQLDEAIGIELDTIQGDSTDTLLEYTIIPIDTAPCVGSGTDDKIDPTDGASSVYAMMSVVLPTAAVSTLLHLLL